MSQYDNTNTGSLFKNDKGDNEKRPDYKGSVNVEGVDYWLSAWIRESGPNSKTPGQKFMSLKLEAKEGQKPTAHQQAKANAYQAEGDVPF